MRILTFSTRNAKEILRDPLTTGFSLGFPVVLLLLFTAIQANAPVEIFAIKHIAPGMTVFGLSFMTLFSATLIARDRESALLQRLYTTPLTAFDFVLGYLLPIVPIATCQCVVCYAAAMALGLPFTVGIVYGVLLTVPISLLYIALGLLCGSLLTVKQVGGICGALLTNLAAWLSGTWFDLTLVGGTFERVAKALPFMHAVEAQRAVLLGRWTDVLLHMTWVMGYAAVILVVAVWSFLRQMKTN